MIISTTSGERLQNFSPNATAIINERNKIKTTSSTSIDAAVVHTTRYSAPSTTITVPDDIDAPPPRFRMADILSGTAQK